MCWQGMKHKTTFTFTKTLILNEHSYRLQSTSQLYFTDERHMHVSSLHSAHSKV